MLSRLFCSTGRIVGKSTKIPLCLRVVSARSNSTNSVIETGTSTIQIKDMNYPARLDDWENFKMPGAPYEGMGPLPPLPDYDQNFTRHYVFPETWFQFLYPRTGATGTYTLLTGLAAMLVSKEYYIYSHDTWYAAAFIIAFTTLNKAVGPFIRDFTESLRVDRLKAYDQVKADEMDGLIKTVDEIKLEQWRAKGQELINEARKTNLAMMLETEYINRQASVVEAVKRKLDYQVTVQKVDTELTQGHMVKWIEKKVMETITPETQKATLNACIAQLNTIASK
ncbi:ATP synthase subunit b, mitochondrial-like [Clavelina lepadiformis]|uniref:ATP synthase subunit b n=1 Tax=Clavelina lepadiformis TaxID=159417 RepID=A0ABP0FXH9_CLALP